MTDYRFQCEVRYVLALRCESREGMLGYLEAVERKRGKSVAQVLKNEAEVQWKLGNRGDWGCWK